MTEIVLGLVAGAGLGAIYFGALWLTVRRMPEATRPGVLVLGSYLARLGALSAGLYGLVRIGGAPALLAALLALLAVRQLAVRWVVPGPRDPAEVSEHISAVGRNS